MPFIYTDLFYRTSFSLYVDPIFPFCIFAPFYLKLDMFPIMLQIKHGKYFIEPCAIYEKFFKFIVVLVNSITEFEFDQFNQSKNPLF